MSSECNSRLCQIQLSRLKSLPTTAGCFTLSRARAAVHFIIPDVGTEIHFSLGLNSVISNPREKEREGGGDTWSPGTQETQEKLYVQKETVELQQTCHDLTSSASTVWGEGRLWGAEITLRVAPLRIVSWAAIKPNAVNVQPAESTKHNTATSISMRICSFFLQASEASVHSERGKWFTCVWDRENKETLLWDSLETDRMLLFILNLSAG